MAQDAFRSSVRELPALDVSRDENVVEALAESGRAGEPPDRDGHSNHLVAIVEGILVAPGRSHRRCDRFTHAEGVEHTPHLLIQRCPDVQLSARGRVRQANRVAVKQQPSRPEMAPEETIVIAVPMRDVP